MNLILGRVQLETIDRVIYEDLIRAGANKVILIDTAGNIVATADNGINQTDPSALAALAAANFGAMRTMAELVGEPEFSLLFHKGQKETLHMSKVSDDFLLLSVFDNQVSVGLFRLKVAEVIEKLVAILEGRIN